MPAMRALGEVLQEYHGEKRSGALFVAVKEKSENLVRIFFKDGEIHHMSYGPSSGKDCLEIVDCYQYSTAYFVSNLKPPAASPDLPPTPKIIEHFQKAGKAVLMQ